MGESVMLSWQKVQLTKKEPLRWALKTLPKLLQTMKSERAFVMPMDVVAPEDLFPNVCAQNVSH